MPRSSTFPHLRRSQSVLFGLQKRTKSKLLSWKVQNSRALDNLEQHDSRTARHVEAKQTAKLQRLYTMASAFGDKPAGVEELEAVRLAAHGVLTNTYFACLAHHPANEVVIGPTHLCDLQAPFVGKMKS